MLNPKCSLGVGMFCEVAFNANAKTNTKNREDDLLNDISFGFWLGGKMVKCWVVVTN